MSVHHGIGCVRGITLARQGFKEEFYGIKPSEMLPALRILAITTTLLLTLAINAQMSGTYTIDGGGTGDYLTFNAAVTDLTALGVSGPVLFEVLPGTYNEQVSITTVAGVSATDTIVFRGSTLDSTDAIISWPTSATNSSSYAVQLSGVDHITFSHLTMQRTGSLAYGDVIVVQNSSTDWNVYNCELLNLQSAPSTSSSFARVIEYNGSSSINAGVVNIRNCRAWQGPIYFNGGGNCLLTIANNVVNNHFSGNCVYLFNIPGDVIIDGNEFTGVGSNSISTVLYLYGCSSMGIQRNTIKKSGTSSGVYIRECIATAADPIVIQNNMIVCTATGSSRSIWTVATNSHIHILNNSISVTAGAEGILFQSGAANITLHNNAIRAREEPFSMSSAALVSSDHNVFYSILGMGIVGGVGTNANSVTADPMFVDNANDLHLQNGSPCHSSGSMFGSISDDIDNESRPMPVATDPDIGADESAWVCIPMAGTYVIGSSGTADYPSFNAAVTGMAGCGIGGPVVFEVEDGTYNEKLILPPVAGTSSSNTITFRGQSLDSSLVMLQTPGGASSTNNYLIQFEGMDHVSWEHISFDRTGSGFYQRLVYYPTLSGEASENTGFSNCRFIGNANAIATNYCIHAPNANNEIRTVIQHCNFSGYRGMHWDANSETEKLIVRGNKFAHNNTVIECFDFADSLLLLDNEIHTSNGTRILLNEIDAPFEVKRNKLTSSSSGYGIYLLGCSPSIATPGVVQNNSIIGGSDAFRLAGQNENIWIVNNSASSLASRLYQDYGTGSGIRLQNNAFQSNSTASSAYVLWKSATSVYTSTSNNLLFKAGSGGFAYWNAYYNDITALQVGTGGFAGSLQHDPLFIDPLNDLHIQSGSPCAGTGTVISVVTSDIDQENRPQPIATAPDIGMDETTEFCEVLSGVYVIGSSVGADFSDFTTPILRMATCGISGPVIFEVEDGTYNEKLVLSPIPGSSAINTITFRGQSMDSSLVTLSSIAQNSSISNYLILMNGMDYVSFEHMRLYRYGASLSNRYAAVVQYATGSDPSQHTRFSNIWFNGDGYSYYYQNSPTVFSNNSTDELSVVIENSRFADGGYAIDWDANGANDQLTVRNCSLATTYDGIRCTAFIGDLNILENTILTFSTTNSNPRGLSLNQCTGGFEISKNLVDINRGTCIYLVASNGTSLVPARITNNSLVAYTSYSGDAGLLVSGDCTELHMLNNSISVLRGRGFYDASQAGSSGMRFVNNAIRANYLSAYPIYRSGSGSFLECEHNVLFNAYSGGVLAWWGTNHYSIASLQTSSSMFANSFESDPMFLNPLSDLHLQLGSVCAGIGKGLSSVNDDIDGESRPNPVATNMDVGSDETSEYCQDLSGTYIIGSSGAADFPDFTTAVSQMLRCGISGPVVFNVETGVYQEKLVLGLVTGNSATNTITFQSITGDSTDVVLTTQAQYNSPNDNYVILMNGADYVTFKSIEIERSGYTNSSIYYSGVIRYGSADPSINCSFENCRILNGGGNTQIRHDLVYSSNTINEENYRFVNCAFLNGLRPIHILGDSQNENLLVHGCTFTAIKGGILVRDLANGGSITNNTLTSFTYANITAIEMWDNSGDWIIAQNKIDAGVTSLYLNNHQGTNASPIRLYNNEFFSQGNRTVWIENSDYVEFSNNSCLATNNHALEVQGTNNLILRNNILATQTAVFPVLVNATTTVSLSDRNLFYRTAGVESVSWGGASYNSIATLSAATGMDANSYFGYAGFYNVNTGDLRSYSMLANNGAIPLSYSNVDINGVTRSATNPDIGAHEFTPELWAEQLDVCHTFDQFTSSGSGLTQYIYADRKVIGSINDNGNVLGIISGSVFVNSGGVRLNPQGLYYMDRNWQIEPSNSVSGVNVDVRLYYSANEFSALSAADASISTTADAGVSQYDGPNENCSIADNTTVGNYFVHYPLPSGTEGEMAPLTQVGYFDLSLSDFSEFYVTGQGIPLPVELLSMTGQRVNKQQVVLRWTTASEIDNQGFELYRRIEGESEFQFIDWIQGAGNSASALDYAFEDYNPTNRISYYYLKQIDFNGAVEDLPMVAVAGMRLENEWVVYPNPATGAFYLDGNVDSILAVSLLDASGRVVRQYSSFSHGFDLSGLSLGMYSVAIQELTGHIRTVRIIIE